MAASARIGGAIEERNTKLSLLDLLALPAGVESTSV
jgi:hypothetical protein